VTRAAGRLLVAAPTLLDPNFSRTVVFVVEHTPDGALGVVLNRPTDRDVGDYFSRWAPLAVTPPVLFEGGPVQSEGALVAFGRIAAPAPGPTGGSASWQPLLGPVGSVDLGVDPGDASPPVEAFRVFVGYAGWGPGQLDDELDAGGWLVVDAAPADLLTDAPGLLWRRVLRRQGGELAMVANQPPDPTVN
jgi:putative transcriptional regulator